MIVLSLRVLRLRAFGTLKAHHMVLSKDALVGAYMGVASLLQWGLRGRWCTWELPSASVVSLWNLDKGWYLQVTPISLLGN